MTDTEKQTNQEKWQARAERLEKAGNSMQEAGAKMQRMGCAMTLLITLPIVGLVVYGLTGLIIGGAIGVLGFIGMFGQKNRQ